MGRRNAAPSDNQTSTGNGEAEVTDSTGSTGGTQTTAQRLAASSNVEVPPEPYAREAKHFTEVRTLHRDVIVLKEICISFA
jgi:staphylococcal nuclease domain-containing protein 1